MSDPYQLTKWMLLLAIAGLLIFSGFTFFYPSKGASNKDVLVLGHAGSGFLSPLNPFNPLPANSMGSIVQAMEVHGADGVEVDVQLSQDGVPVLYHDADLKSQTEAQGLIEHHKAAEVVGLKYKGGFFYDLFQEEHIISLEEVLQRFSSYPQWPYLHLDLRNYDASRKAYYAQKVIGLVQQYDYPFDRLVFISPDPLLLEAFRQQAPQALLMLDSSAPLEAALATAQEHKLWGICTNGKHITAAQVQQARKQGLRVVLFGGKSCGSISRMIALAPDAIQVNNVAAMRGLLDQAR